VWIIERACGSISHACGQLVMDGRAWLTSSPLQGIKVEKEGSPIPQGQVPYAISNKRHPHSILALSGIHLPKSSRPALVQSAPSLAPSLTAHHFVFTSTRHLRQPIVPTTHHVGPLPRQLCHQASMAEVVDDSTRQLVHQRRRLQAARSAVRTFSLHQLRWQTLQLGVGYPC
jgi:hypothetical protein